MNYFLKIEAYLEGDLSDTERLVFEQELEENPILQIELAAMKEAQCLFDFVADYSVEIEDDADSPEATVEVLLGFVTQQLSEEEILANPNVIEAESVIRPLKLHRNIAVWLTAASVLLMLGVFGFQFLNSYNTLKPTDSIAEVVPSKAVEADKIIVPRTIEFIGKKASEKTNTIVEAVIPQAKKNKSKRAASNPKKVTPTPKNLLLAANQKAQKPKGTLIETTPIAQTIQSKTVVTEGKDLTYQAKETITLKTGFHAKAGATFTAITQKQVASKDIATDVVVSANESVVLQAGNTILLQPGFHAKVGAEFVAKVN